MLYVIAYSVVSLSLISSFLFKFALGKYKGFRTCSRNELYVGFTSHDNYFIDVFKFPHTLISGSTNSGKTNLIKCMIYNLIQFKNVDVYIMSVRKLDYYFFNNKFSNLFISTGIDDIYLKLKSIHKELLIREKELNHHVKYSNKKLKYIFFDEFSFLISDGKNDVNKDFKEEILNIIKEIAKIGSALGFYLIIGTQRADSKILDGQIKANCNSHITFKQINSINSQIALGHSGAEELEKYQVICLTDSEIILNTPEFLVDLQ